MRQRAQAPAYPAIQGRIDRPAIVSIGLFVFCKLAIVYLGGSFLAVPPSACHRRSDGKLSHETA